MDLHSLSIDEVWQDVIAKAREEKELFEGMETTYEFKLTDLEDGTYYLVFADQDINVTKDEVTPVHCTLEMKKKHFIYLLEGKLNSTSAFMTGRLKVKGNIGLALKLEKLFKQLTN